jgi:hypothetical protein
MWIDNLNGDKCRTGKIIPKGLPGAGSRDDSIFTTEMDPRGIQPGNSNRHLGKTERQENETCRNSRALPRILGTGSSQAARPCGQPASGFASPRKQRSRVRNLEAFAGEPVAACAENVRRRVRSVAQSRRAVSDKFSGVNHNRGLEGGVIDTNRASLEERMRTYFAAKSFQAAQKVSAEAATERARYDPEKAWTKLREAGHFRKDTIIPFLTFPFDRLSITSLPTNG